MTARKLFLLGFAAALVAALGCSNTDDGGTPSPALACSDGGAAGVNAVNLSCGGATDSTTEQVNVVMGGPAAGSTALRGLNFDVTYDATKIDFVPAASNTSALFPNALVAVTLFNGLPGRVVVSIQQVGGDPDVSVAPGQHVVLSLSFRRAAGTTFGPRPLALENAEATGASTAIGFSSVLALSYQ